MRNASSRETFLLLTAGDRLIVLNVKSIMRRHLMITRGNDGDRGKFYFAWHAPAGVYFLGIDSTISPHYVEINCVIFVLPDDRSDFLRENKIIDGGGKN